MTETSQTLLDSYQIRKTKAQKASFRNWLCEKAAALGYTYTEEKGLFGAKNVVIGDVDRAKVVCTAHYDTAPVLPFPNFITPKKFSIYLLYQIALVLGFFAVSALLGLIYGVLLGVASAIFDMSKSLTNALIDLAPLLMLLWVLPLLFGPANKHTANDNTSGVATLLDIMENLPEVARGTVAFVFFDLEEMGLFGSAGFAAKHKKVMKDKPLINFDCVSDGKHILLAVRKNGGTFVPLLERYFQSRDGFCVEVCTTGVFYPSDQANFPCGIGVAALRWSERFKLLYMNRIHTKKDVIFEAKNITFLRECTMGVIAELTDEVGAITPISESVSTK